MNKRVVGIKKNNGIWKETWVIKPKSLLMKIKDSLLYWMTLGGVFLVSYSIYSEYTRHWLFKIGFFLSLFSVVIRDTKSSVNGSTRPTLLRFVLYVVSISGLGLFFSGFWFLLSANTIEFLNYMILGLVLILVSRFNYPFKGLKYLLVTVIQQLCVFGGVVLAMLGFHSFDDGFMIPMVLVILGLFLTPIALIWRERSSSRRRDKDIKRKFFSLLSVTLGIVLLTSGVLSFYSGNYLYLLLVLEGSLCLIGGSIVNRNSTLVSLRGLI